MRPPHTTRTIYRKIRDYGIFVPASSDPTP